MQTGTVKWFNNAKGYGFILPDDGSGDVFVHYSSITMEGYKTLKAGQLVSYEPVAGPKGTHASNTQALDNALETGMSSPSAQATDNYKAEATAG
jgi:CspA family cold shock protein